MDFFSSSDMFTVFEGSPTRDSFRLDSMDSTASNATLFWRRIIWSSEKSSSNFSSVRALEKKLRFFSEVWCLVFGIWSSGSSSFFLNFEKKDFFSFSTMGSFSFSGSSSDSSLVSVSDFLFGDFFFSDFFLLDFFFSFFSGSSFLVSSMISSSVVFETQFFSLSRSLPNM